MLSVFAIAYGVCPSPGAPGDFLAAYPSKIRALINDTGDKTLIGAGIKRELKKGEEGDRNIANG